MTATIPEAFTLAVQHHQTGRLAEAEGLYRQILAVEPNHAGARHFLGVIALQSGRNETAIEWIRQAIALDPNNADAYSNLGEVYRISGRLQEAIASYRQALQLKPSYPAAHNNLGIVLAAQGQFDEAVLAYRRAIALHPNYPEAYNNLGGALADEGQFDEAIAAYRRALELRPNYPQAHNDLGNVFYHRSQFEEAATAYRRALAFNPDYAEAHNNLGNALWKLDQLDGAIVAYRRAIALKVSYAQAHNNLGGILQEKGRLDEALPEFRRALELDPELPEAHNNLGNALHDQGQCEEAVAAYQRALELKPDMVEVHNNLAHVLIGQGRFNEAITACHRALALKPDYPEARNNLGNALKGLGQLDEAMAAYRQALTFKPDYAGAWINLGAALAEMAHLDEAVAAFRHALEFKPDSVEAHNNLGNALKDRGELDEAIAAYRRVLQLNSQSDRAHSNLIYMLHFHPGLEQETIAEEQRSWNRQFVEPLAASILPHTNKRDPERRLRIGYVSPDFRDHAVAFFLAPLLEAHDHQRFEIFGYSSVSRPDAVTARLRQSTDAWREVRYLSDAQLAERIRQDGIDILVDLTLHTAGNRLLTLARKPAPMQVSWLGMPGSPGLETVDYWLSDRFLDPTGEESTGQPGRPFRLPDAWCCCSTPADSPEVSPLPALTTGAVTFASFNNFAKINEPVLALWARVLAAVPGSRLRLLARAGGHQQRAKAFLQKCGVAPERCEFLAHEAAIPGGSTGVSLRRYLEADIALDPFPYNGMTTSCHALWMGVPVVTRTGASAVSRAGMSLLHTLGLPELVAQSEEEYARIAVELATNLTRLAELRATLRAKMTASPLMDAPRFARNIEAAYRMMWRQWCQERSSR